MLQINKQLNDASGGKVASGTVIDFTTFFPAKREMKIVFVLWCYKSLSVFENGDKSYIAKEVPDNSPVYEMTEQDFKKLTPLVVNQKLAELIVKASDGKISIDDIEIII